MRVARDSVDMTSEEQPNDNSRIDEDNYTFGTKCRKNSGRTVIMTNRFPLSQEQFIQTESEVGKKLSELTTKKVIILALGMILCLPLFYANMYVDDNNTFEFGLKLLLINIHNQKSFNSTLSMFIESMNYDNYPILHLNVDEAIY